ncbi:ATP/GTP-binding protein, partial [Aeromicrobium phragmitis]
HEGIPVLGDLLNLIRSAPDELRQMALDRGELDRYRATTQDLEAALIALVDDDRLGALFNTQTTETMDLSRPVVFDVSSLNDEDDAIKAAVLMSCWSAGFGAINVTHALADAGLEPQRRFFVVLDELWRTLRTAPGLVDRVDALTRLNRQWGVGQAMISHTTDDLKALPSAEDRAKALGFVERAGFVVLGGVPSREVDALSAVI